MKISQNLQKQVDYLHHVVGKDEWCGLLIYQIQEGNIDDPDNLILLADGIYLMDIGSAAHTTYNMRDLPADQKFDVYDQYPQLEEVDKGWRFGFVHSHQSMSCFFSKTDEDEQKDNTENYNIFLSLIVGFDLQYDARISYIIEEEIESSFSFKDVFNNIFKSTKEKEVHKLIAYHDCNIKIDFGVKDWFKDRYETIKESKKTKVTRVPQSSWGTYNNGYGHHNSYNNTHQQLSNKYTDFQKRKFCIKLIEENPSSVSNNLYMAFNPYRDQYDKDPFDLLEIVDECIDKTLLTKPSDKEREEFLEEVYDFIHDDSFSKSLVHQFKGMEAISTLIFNILNFSVFDEEL